MGRRKRRGSLCQLCACIALLAKKKKKKRCQNYILLFGANFSVAFTQRRDEESQPTAVSAPRCSRCQRAVTDRLLPCRAPRSPAAPWSAVPADSCCLLETKCYTPGEAAMTSGAGVIYLSIYLFSSFHPV